MLERPVRQVMSISEARSEVKAIDAMPTQRSLGREMIKITVLKSAGRPLARVIPGFPGGNTILCMAVDQAVPDPPAGNGLTT